MTAAMLVLIPALAQAQLISVDINRANLEWTATLGPSDGPPDEFRVKCGNAKGVYTKVTPLGPTMRKVPVKAVVGGTGSWFCAVSAVNQFGESGDSNEVFFTAGAAPSTPTNTRVTVQP